MIQKAEVREPDADGNETFYWITGEDPDSTDEPEFTYSEDDLISDEGTR